jgi:hypothetical protein
METVYRYRFIVTLHRSIRHLTSGAAARTHWAAPGPHRPGGGAPGVDRGDYGHLWAQSLRERPRWLLRNRSSTADASQGVLGRLLHC